MEVIGFNSMNKKLGRDKEYKFNIWIFLIYIYQDLLDFFVNDGDVRGSKIVIVFIILVYSLVNK